MPATLPATRGHTGRPWVMAPRRLGSCALALNSLCGSEARLQAHGPFVPISTGFARGVAAVGLRAPPLPRCPLDPSAALPALLPFSGCLLRRQHRLDIRPHRCSSHSVWPLTPVPWTEGRCVARSRLWVRLGNSGSHRVKSQEENGWKLLRWVSLPVAQAPPDVCGWQRSLECRKRLWVPFYQQKQRRLLV